MRLRPFVASCLALAIAGISHAGEMIPFVLPWNDEAPGITDLSDLNHTPAGKHGFLTVDENAHFSANGERVRFWGVNITADSCFPTHAEADAIAARLAKFGFNIVRFHHMDNNWGNGSLIDYSQGDSRDLHAENLERLDYFIAKLKEHGIYANINLINSREFMVADGLDPQIESQLEWKERHILGFVDPTFRDLEKEFAQKLLTHLNPHTGLTYAEDPAIAVVEINNENGIFQQFFEGAIESWPTVYKNSLQNKWNVWLQIHYEDSAELIEAWSGETVPFGEQLITDPSFSNGVQDWNLEQHDGASASQESGTFAERQALKLEVVQTGSQGWHIQLNQSGIEFVEDQLYTLSFWARADATRTISAAIGQAYDPWGTILSYPNLPVDSEWKQYEFIFSSSVSDDNLRLNFNGFAGETGAVYFSDVTLTEGADLAASLPEGQTLETGNIASNSITGTYLPNRQLDWTRFLISLAENYWTDMGDYLKNDLGYGGFVNGTTIMNSTPNIQGVFDLVDTHSYWRHPVFTGESWDPENWYVEPHSMVNVLDNTIADLARQRIDGFPHTVSEYRHSYPNPYASEGPLIVGAYAALQDWDGIYFFDYARGASWDQSYFDNYFNMNSHPSSMANALAAARMFREGHVSAASGQLLFNFNPELEAELVATRGMPWNVGDGRQLDIQPEHALHQRIALSIGEEASGIIGELPDPPSGPAYLSDTGELTWNYDDQGESSLTVATDSTLSSVGFESSVDFSEHGISIEIGDTQQNWSTITLVATTGSFAKPFASTSILVVATGLTENTNMQWTDESKRSVASNWGESPSLTEAIPATLSLPYDAERVQAWTLDETGQRGDSITVTPNGDGALLQIGETQKSLWYEIEVDADPGHDPYQSWREQHWQNDALADPNISGPAADPDGDQIKNLVEFLAALDPNSPDADAPIKQSVFMKDGKPVFRYEFRAPSNYSISELSITQSGNLALWEALAADGDKLDVSIIPYDESYDQITIDHTPATFPAFSRLVGPSE